MFSGIKEGEKEYLGTNYSETCKSSQAPKTLNQSLQLISIKIL